MDAGASEAGAWGLVQTAFASIITIVTGGGLAVAQRLSSRMDKMQAKIDAIAPSIEAKATAGDDKLWLAIKEMRDDTARRIDAIGQDQARRLDALQTSMQEFIRDSATYRENMLHLTCTKGDLREAKENLLELLDARIAPILEGQRARRTRAAD